MVFFKKEESNNCDNIWIEFPVEKTGGNKLKISEKIYEITPGIQKVLLTDTSNILLKKLKDKDEETFNNILESLDFGNYKVIRGESKSSRYTQSKTSFEKHVKKFNLEGQGIEKNIIPSNIFDIYTRLEVLLGLKLFGQTNTLTEAINITDKLYKRGEVQNEQQF